MKIETPSCRGHRFPPEIISHAVWFYCRFCLSLRDVEDLLAERAPLESVIPDPRYADRWSELFDGSYRDEVVLLNFNSFNESPDVPDDEEGVDTEEVFDRYREKAFRVLGRMGAQIDQVGSVESVVVGPEARNYEAYGFVLYPSVSEFEVVFTARERVDAQVHQRAALSAEGSAGYWTKPYDEFTSR